MANEYLERRLRIRPTVRPRRPPSKSERSGHRRLQRGSPLGHTLKPLRKRLLFALPANDMGGAERVVLNLLRHIDREQFELHLTTLTPGVMPTEEILGFVEIHDIGIRRARWAVLPISKLCWKIHPDVVLSMSAHLSSMIVASRPLLPSGTSFFVRETSDITSPKRAPGAFKSLVYKQAYQRADLVICQSEAMKDDLVQHFELQPSKVLRIYNPVDIEAINALAEAEPNPFFAPGPNLVSVGRLCPNKGFDLLLKAMRWILAAFPSVRATVIGEGPELPALMAEQQQLGLESIVRFVAPRRNPFPFLKHADLLVLTSRSEAMPNVVLEAIALGTPAVSTSCTAALPELNSCTRLLRVAQDRTPEALAREVISALSCARPKPRRVESEFEERFGVRNVVRQYENAFSQRASAQVSPGVEVAS
jgi:glycosyltransferase involved in cell wall biosynthesis